MRFLKVLISALLILTSSSALAGDDEDVARLLSSTLNKSVADKIDIFSEYFVGRPYQLEALGEGETGRFDRDPLYRFDAFDCTTFVETVLALSYSSSIEDFRSKIVAIRYKHGDVAFENRNHFTELDWIPNNTDAGFVTDITFEVAYPRDVNVADTIIKKKAWYEKRPLSYINVPGISDAEKIALHDELRSLGAVFGDVEVKTPFVSMNVLFQDGAVDQKLLDRIPDAAIVNIVRPNWNVETELGTRLNISHQAILVRKNGKILMRHASSSKGKVVEMLFSKELKTYLAVPSIGGVSFLSQSR